MSKFTDITEGDMTYGEVLAWYLEEMGITQSELARRLGTGRQTINSIVKGDRLGPRLDTALHIADALGVSIQDMVAMMKSDDGQAGDVLLENQPELSDGHN